MATIDKSQLQQGDILIYHGTRWISRAIRFFDNSFYNHASVYMGDERVLEAIPKGVVSTTLTETVEFSGTDPVTVVRLVNRPPDMTPVLLSAKKYEGVRYAFEQILLLLLICSLRRVRRNNFFFRFLRKAIEVAATILLTFTGGNKKAMICSELVFRAYNEAQPGQLDPFTIVIDGRAFQVAPLSASPMAVNMPDNLLSFFYGPGNQLSFTTAANSPFVSPANVTATMAQITAGPKPSDPEMDKLLDDVIKSYQQEDYRLDATEVAQTKASVDFFIASSVKLNASATPLSGSTNLVDLFLQENANFVTPGDFIRSSSVTTIGNLDLDNL